MLSHRADSSSVENYAPTLFKLMQYVMQFKAKRPGRGGEGGEQKTNLGEKKLDAHRQRECIGRHPPLHVQRGL